MSSHPHAGGGDARAHDVEDLRDVAVSAVLRAAEVVLAVRGDGDLHVATKSSTTDPVTAADHASEEALVRFLAEERPDDGVLGEEGAARPARTGLRWVLDPIDGTVNFLYGHPGWCVSVACEAQDRDAPGEWRAVAGAVLDPVSGELYTAALGAGAHLQRARPHDRWRRRLRVNDPVELAQALVATGFAYDRGHRARQGAVAVRVLAAARDLRRVGAAALDLCAVAAGRVDAYYEDSTHRWDIAAGSLIAREAGAEVIPLPGGPPGAEGVVAAGPTLAPVLAGLVAHG